MTKEEEKQLWIKILQPLADLAKIREYLASHPKEQIAFDKHKSKG